MNCKKTNLVTKISQSYKELTDSKIVLYHGMGLKYEEINKLFNFFFSPQVYKVQ